MRVFLVHAHPEPTSFNGSLTRAAVSALRHDGHEAWVSDLYAMGFDPVSDRRNFRSVANSSRLVLQDEESHAAAHDGYAAVLDEQWKQVRLADVLVFQFPLWWMGMPAILKGWIDRVFSLGRAYGGGRYFSKGALRGKRAMLSVTVGGPEDAYGDRGAYDPLAHVLQPIHHGILAFVGLTVLEPFIVHAPSRLSDVERAQVLDDYRARVRTLDRIPSSAPLDVAGYEGLVQRPGAAPAVRRTMHHP